MTRTHRHPMAALPALLLALVGLAGCEETTVEALDQQLTLEESAELALVEDEGSRGAALELTEATNADLLSGLDASAGLGRELVMQANIRLAAADGALHSGDRRRALDEAREARRLLARAIVARGGAEAVVALIERIEDLAAQIEAEDEDVFDDPAAVRARLEALAAEARAYMEGGELVRAAERALLGEQIIRYHRRRNIGHERAELAVSLAATAVHLAERLVSDDPTPVRAALSTTEVRDRQNRWLVYAQGMLARARLALGNGNYARAGHLAWHAHWAALKAVILQGGITEEEITAMVELAHHLYAEAAIAIGEEPTELEARLFARAGRLIELGEKMIADGLKRGVAPIWRAAVISRWLMD